MSGLTLWTVRTRVNRPSPPCLVVFLSLLAVDRSALYGNGRPSGGRSGNSCKQPDI